MFKKFGSKKKDEPKKEGLSFKKLKKQKKEKIFIIEDFCAFPDSPERCIKTIIIGNDCNLRVGNRPHQSLIFHDELLGLSKQLGFKVRKGWNGMANGSWLRDSQIALTDGSFLLPFTVVDAVEFIDMKQHDINYAFEGASKWLLPVDSYVNWEEHIDYKNVAFRVFSNPETERLQDFAQMHGLRLRKGRTIVEGGNILVVEKPNGRSSAIIGEASLIQSMLVLQIQNAFSEEQIKMQIKELERRAQHDGSLTLHELDAVYRRLIKALNRSDSDEELWNPLIASVLEDAKLVKQLSRNEELKDKYKRILVLTYLAKLELTKPFIAADLNMRVEDLVFIEQPAFHLDMAMAIGPQGQILMQSQRVACRFLKNVLQTLRSSPSEQTTSMGPRIEKPRKGLTRTPSLEVLSGPHREPRELKRTRSIELVPQFIIDREERFEQRLRDYLESAKLLRARIEPLEIRIFQKLTDAGYKCIPVAGCFVDIQKPRFERRPINFFNHLGGTCKDGMFYITNGVGGKKAAKIFQDCFVEEILLPLGYTKVFFLGCENGIAHDSINEMGALRCLTTVLPRHK